MKKKKEITIEEIREKIEHLDEDQFFKQEGYKDYEVTPLKSAIAFILAVALILFSIFIGMKLDGWL